MVDYRRPGYSPPPEAPDETSCRPEQRARSSRTTHEASFSDRTGRRCSITDRHGRNTSAGTEEVLLSKPGLVVKGNCTTSLVQVKFEPVPSGSVWILGIKRDEDDANLSVKLDIQTKYWEATAQYMHIDGLLYVSSASPGNHQIDVQARQTASGSCPVQDPDVACRPRALSGLT